MEKINRKNKENEQKRNTDLDTIWIACSTTTIVVVENSDLGTLYMCRSWCSAFHEVESKQKRVTWIINDIGDLGGKMGSCTCWWVLWSLWIWFLPIGCWSIEFQRFEAIADYSQIESNYIRFGHWLLWDQSRNVNWTSLSYVERCIRSANWNRLPHSQCFCSLMFPSLSSRTTYELC